MMNSVMRRSVENELKPWMQFANCFSVNPELIEHVDGVVQRVEIRWEKQRHGEIKWLFESKKDINKEYKVLRDT
jgi:enoyl reductase-like protein